MSRMSEIIEYLKGTCESLDSGCNACGYMYEDLIDEELQELYDTIFQCDECSWWHELWERSWANDSICRDCANDDTAVEED